MSRSEATLLERSGSSTPAGGSTWAAYFAAQSSHWYIQGMNWRLIWGFVTAAGIVLLIWDLLTIGKGETRPMELATEVEAETAA